MAISGDGSELAFTVVGQSDLTSGSARDTTTPGAEVVVRNLRTHTTVLVSQTQSSLGPTPQPVAGGAAITDTSTGIATTAQTKNADPGDSTAAISADGSTVAWLGIDIPAQAPAGAQDVAVDHPSSYNEPLWRGSPTARSPPPGG